MQCHNRQLLGIRIWLHDAQIGDYQRGPQCPNAKALPVVAALAVPKRRDEVDGCIDKISHVGELANLRNIRRIEAI